jgi:membrane-bound serine protease (ClpP class)
MKRTLLVNGFAMFFLLALTLPVFAGTPQVGLIRLDGIVHPITAEYIIESLHQCDARGYAAAVIQINTPGGLDTAMRDIISAILASRTPVVVWVGPSGSRAASAGFLILLSADVAAMALGTNTGAAHPVFMSGQEMTDTMKKKVENDAAAYVRSFTGPRARNPEMAEQGILESRSFSENEALSNKMIDVIAASPEELVKKLDGREIKRFQGQTEVLHLDGAQIVPLEPSARQSFLSSVIEPNIALVLMALGALGIFVEFNHPGIIVPGVVGAIALILGLFAITILPVSLTGALLIALAFTLFILEAKIMTHGILAFGGIVSMVLGAVILIDSPIPEMRVRLGTALALALPMAVITVFLLRLAMKARAAKVTTGAAGLLDEIGEAHEDFAAEESGFGGQIFVQGEIWRAHSTVPISRGARLRVRAVERLRLQVELVADPAGPSGGSGKTASVPVTPAGTAA